MARKGNGAGENGSGKRAWGGLPYTLMALAVLLFALTLVINVPNTVALDANTPVFADKWLTRVKLVTSSEMRFNISEASLLAYEVKDVNGTVVGWVPKTKTTADTYLAFGLILSCILFVGGLNLWAVSLRTQRYVSGPPVPIVIAGGYSASVNMKVRYSFSVSLGDTFLHDVGRLVRSAMVGRNILSVMETLGALIARKSANLTSVQVRDEVPKMVEEANSALRVFNREGVTSANRKYLTDALSADVLEQLQTVYVPIDQIIAVVDLAAETVEAEREAGRARAEDIVAMPLLIFAVDKGILSQSQADDIGKMPLEGKQEWMDWLADKKQAYIDQLVAVSSAESGARQAEAKTILARRASEGLELAKTGGGDIIARAIEFVKALMAG